MSSMWDKLSRLLSYGQSDNENPNVPAVKTKDPLELEPKVGLVLPDSEAIAMDLERLLDAMRRVGGDRQGPNTAEQDGNNVGEATAVEPGEHAGQAANLSQRILPIA